MRWSRKPQRPWSGMTQLRRWRSYWAMVSGLRSMPRCSSSHSWATSANAGGLSGVVARASILAPYSWASWAVGKYLDRGGPCSG